MDVADAVLESLSEVVTTTRWKVVSPLSTLLNKRYLNISFKTKTKTAKFILSEELTK